MDISDLEISTILKKQFPDFVEQGLLDEIAAAGRLVHFKAGTVILNYGSYIQSVPLVLKGTIKVVRESKEDERELFLYYLNEGETCSMSFSCCMSKKKSDIRTIAEEDSTIIALPIKEVDNWMTKYKSWKNFILRSYDLRLHEMVKTIDSISFKKMDDRLLEYIQQKSAVNNSQILHTTHQQIAADLNASREAISRLLKNMEKNKILKLSRNKIEILQ